MSTTAFKLSTAVLLLAGAASALAEVHYVDVNSTNATPPYTNWTTAATNIQDAVDAAVAGDEVVVTNGIYATGGRDGNSVKADKALSVCSVNGPQFTTVSGGGTNRCAYLTNGASLSGFSLTSGIANLANGGGVFCESQTAVVSNCIVSANSSWGDGLGGANGFGGGAYGGTLNNCVITRNSAHAVGITFGPAGYGGAAAYCTLNNCTITGNSASAYPQPGQGGGAYACTLNNCIVYFNNSTNGANYDISCTLNYSCTTPQFTSGVGNITNAPLFVDTNGWANLRLQSNSPCINAGNNAYAVGSTDLDGNPRIVGGTVDIGAYEFQAVRYVDVNSTNPTPPYSSWATAATSIQDAVDAAVAGDEIVVTNGIYCPVSVNKALNVRSANGPQVTTIDGGGACRCVSLAGNASLSGFTLTDGVSGGGGGAYGGTLNNCTLTGNSVIAYGFGGNPIPLYAWGGGAWNSTLNNCTLSGNSAIARNYIHAANEPVAWGGGAFGCTLNNCVLSGNSASASSDFTASGASGGGANNCELNNCTVTGNSASATSGNLSPGTWAGGGGAYSSTLNNCISFGNNHYVYVPGNRTCEDCGGDPGFVDTNGWANLRLQSNSPYINAGNNAYAPAGPDLDGNPRIAGGTVDIGAYEFQAPASMISYAWLQQFNLPINPATDTADPDHDGVNNYHEWLAGTDPTNPLSSPAQLIIIPSGTSVILAWSTNAVGFTLQSATNLVSPAVWRSDSPAPVVINGQNTVTNPFAGPQQFFRLSQ